MCKGTGLMLVSCRYRSCGDRWWDDTPLCANPAGGRTCDHGDARQPPSRRAHPGHSHWQDSIPSGVRATAEDPPGAASAVPQHLGTARQACGDGQLARHEQRAKTPRAVGGQRGRTLTQRLLPASHSQTLTKRVPKQQHSSPSGLACYFIPIVIC
ncbi:hypothetical protein B566_EDAN005566 [Ephemera danica]|nr:hypothetical protein B566_EDAN005566 [Ephemera danica]